MRLTLFIIAIFFVALPARAHDAYVSVRVALARSGPGMSHYPTDPLPRGERVEVIDQQDQWLAIKAPADSFSWVPGEHLQISDDGTTAEVIKDDVQSWIGSHVTEIEEHVYQVQLRKGERVEVLDKKQLKGGSDSLMWVKIRPPVGEIRWINASEVTDKAPPAARVAQTHATPHKSEQRAAPADDGDEDQGWVERGHRPIRRPSVGTAEVNATTRSTPAPKAMSRTELNQILAAPTGSSFDDLLARMQLALSRVAASGASLEELDLLEAKANALVRAGKSAYERGQATLLLESIADFRKLAERNQDSVALTSYARNNTSRSATATEKLSGKKLSLDPKDAKSGEKDAGDEEDPVRETEFVAKGWLMPVSSPSQNAPPFVLMDEEGNPISFVTPEPGLNLRTHTNEEVGIIGRKSFPVFNREHVIANRAVMLQRHRDGDTPMARSFAPWIRYR